MLRIGHYAPRLWEPGGIASYIRRVSDEQMRLGNEVFFFDLEQFRSHGREVPLATEYLGTEDAVVRRTTELRLDLLHTHGQLSNAHQVAIPMIRTVHGHQPYCPSGTRYLRNQRRPCNRSYSILGCTWGHLVDHCGSVRPARLVDDFRRTRSEMRTLKGRWITTVSQFMKDQMVRDGYDSHLIHVLYLPAPPVRETDPPPSDGIPRFVFLGRLTELKGVDWLLRSLARTKTPIRVDIAGEGDLRSELERLTDALALRSRVSFVGWVGPDEVMRLIRDCRAVVFPSVWHEPGGTVAFEAMVNARAVIMSQVGGMPEIVREGVNGLLVPPNDEQALADAMDRLAADHPLAKGLGATGRALAATQYTLHGHVARLMDIYQQCIASHRC